MLARDYGSPLPGENWISACVASALPWGVLSAIAEAVSRGRLEKKEIARKALKAGAKASLGGAAVACVQGIVQKRIANWRG